MAGQSSSKPLLLLQLPTRSQRGIYVALENAEENSNWLVILGKKAGERMEAAASSRESLPALPSAQVQPCALLSQQ